MQPFIHATVQPCNRSSVQSLAWQFSRMTVQWYKASVVQSFPLLKPSRSTVQPFGNHSAEKP